MVTKARVHTATGLVDTQNLKNCACTIKLYKELPRSVTFLLLSSKTRNDPTKLTVNYLVLAIDGVVHAWNIRHLSE